MQAVLRVTRRDTGSSCQKKKILPNSSTERTEGFSYSVFTLSSVVEIETGFTAIACLNEVRLRQTTAVLPSGRGLLGAQGFVYAVVAPAEGYRQRNPSREGGFFYQALSFRCGTARARVVIMRSSVGPAPSPVIRTRRADVCVRGDLNDG